MDKPFTPFRPLMALSMMFLSGLLLCNTSLASDSEQPADVATHEEQAQPDSPEQDPPSVETLPLEELSAFADAYRQIKSSYVREVTDQKLLESAIRGMLSSLDPHSAYLSDREFEDLETSATGEYGGLGLQVESQDGFIRVITPMDDTPAERGGIQSGDILIKIEGKPLAGMPVEEVLEQLRGEPGTDIELGFMREGQGEYELRLTREVIRITSVRSRLLQPDMGYIRISEFQRPTDKEVISALEQLVKTNENPLKGLVLDLRNNPGGVLGAAVGVSDAFMQRGRIVYTQGRSDESYQSFDATPGDLLKGAPIVVLINNGSASASEIVAGALQDQGRAVLLGTRSFGKGSVQTVLPVHGNAVIKLTTALYYTPSGRSIQGHGIDPDIEVEQGKLVVSPGRREFHEADLPGSLANGNGDTAPEVTDKDETVELQEPENDFQLDEAVKILQGIILLQRKVS